MEKADGPWQFFYRLLIEILNYSNDCYHEAATSQNISNGIYLILKAKISQGRFIDNDVA